MGSQESSLYDRVVHWLKNQWILVTIMLLAGLLTGVATLIEKGDYVRKRLFGHNDGHGSSSPVDPTGVRAGDQIADGPFKGGYAVKDFGKDEHPNESNVSPNPPEKKK